MRLYKAFTIKHLIWSGLYKAVSLKHFVPSSLYKAVSIKKLNELNLSLQVGYLTALNVYKKGKAFEKKLELWIS